MADAQKQFLSKLISGLGETMYIVGQKALFEAQSTVPVKTGALKATGVLSKKSGNNQYKKSYVITFGNRSVLYAKDVEEGREGTAHDPSPYTYNVRAHKRKAPKKIAVKAYPRGGGTVQSHRRGGQTNVRAHTATLIAQRRVRLEDGSYITTRGIGAVKATHFLRNAIEKIMKENFGSAMKEALPTKMKLKA